jgi:hypothetical protein
MFPLDIVLLVWWMVLLLSRFWNVDAPKDLKIWIGTIVVPNLGMCVFHVIWNFCHLMVCMDAGVSSWDYIVVTQEVVQFGFEPFIHRWSIIEIVFVTIIWDYKGVESRSDFIRLYSSFDVVFVMLGLTMFAWSIISAKMDFDGVLWCLILSLF